MRHGREDLAREVDDVPVPLYLNDLYDQYEARAQGQGEMNWVPQPNPQAFPRIPFGARQPPPFPPPNLKAQRMARWRQEQARERPQNPPPPNWINLPRAQRRQQEDPPQQPQAAPHYIDDDVIEVCRFCTQDMQQCECKKVNPRSK